MSHEPMKFGYEVMTKSNYDWWSSWVFFNMAVGFGTLSYFRFEIIDIKT